MNANAVWAIGLASAGILMEALIWASLYRKARKASAAKAARSATPALLPMIARCLFPAAIAAIGVGLGIIASERGLRIGSFNVVFLMVAFFGFSMGGITFARRHERKKLARRLEGR